MDSERVFQDSLWILKGWPMDFLACAVYFERDCPVILIGLSIDSECISQAFLRVFQWILEGISSNGVWMLNGLRMDAIDFQISFN